MSHHFPLHGITCGFSSVPNNRNLADLVSRSISESPRAHDSGCSFCNSDDKTAEKNDTKWNGRQTEAFLQRCCVSDHNFFRFLSFSTF